MAPSQTLVIFGASGDLTSRLLLPALGQLLARDDGRTVRLIGVDRKDWDDATWADVVRHAFRASDCEAAERHVTCEYRRADLTSADDLRALFDGLTGPVALYFAVPPSVAAAACEVFATTGLPDGAVLALEKPFGADVASARRLNEALAGLVPEEQVFRVDHFLGKATTLNLLGVRFANRLLAPLWSASDIESIDLVYEEALALEGRAGYYDRAGALTDMIQSHLLQLMSVVMLEEPATIGAVDFRAATSAVLRATHVWQDDPVGSSRRARYTAGEVDGVAKPSYVDEPGVDPARETETLAEMTVEVRNARWAGMPVTLRTGKAVSDPVREIVVRFRPVRHVPDGLIGDAPGAVLRFSLGPDQVSLELNVSGPGNPFELERATLTTELGEGALLAYAEVLQGVLDGDPLLSVRGDAAEECWRIVQPVLDAWHRDEVPLDEYPAGTHGPASWPRLD